MPPMMPDFNPAETPVEETFDMLPNGWYAMTFESSEMVPTKACERGEYKAYMWKFVLVMSEAHHPSMKGRKQWDSLNLINEKPETGVIAVEISRKRLAAMWKAAGITQPGNDTDVLNGITVAVKVGIKAARTGEDGKSYDARNEIKGYDSLANRAANLVDSNTRLVSTAPAAVAPTAQAAPADGGAAPWDD